MTIHDLRLLLYRLSNQLFFPLVPTEETENFVQWSGPESGHTRDEVRYEDACVGCLENQQDIPVAIFHGTSCSYF